MVCRVVMTEFVSCQNRIQALNFTATYPRYTNVFNNDCDFDTVFVLNIHTPGSGCSKHR